jgi:hypothetical protein
MAEAFKQSKWGQQIREELAKPVQPEKPLELSTRKYALNRGAMFRALLRRELILMRRNRFLYTFRTVQVGLFCYLLDT